MTCDLSIIIVSWNVADLLRDCLRSIDENRGELDLEVIVVDSASSDDSVAMVQREFPWVTLLPCDENVGFPRGNNLGLAQANGRYLLLLNPDTVVLNDALSKMMAYIQENPGIGVLGSQLLNGDGTVQSSRRRFPTAATAFFESTWLETIAPKAIQEKYYAQDLPDDAINDVDWVMGACMLLPRQVVAEVGGLDEAYFMYSEELDWCRRIKDSGWRVVYYPEAQIIHYVGQSSDQAVVARHINFQQAKLRYFRKYNGRFFAILLRIFLLLNYSWQIVLEGGKGLLGHKRPLRRQRIQAYWQVIRSGLRPAGY
ncbi:MAG: glycosyltransferase family 2 protein [Anaerolineae bacterium]|nr:glycosyltransferase family 2 protein [Anaerolineae bacterium]